MKIWQGILYFLLALFLVIFDVSFLSKLVIFDASILSSFLILIIYAMTDKRRDFIFFAFFVAIFFTIFSSLSVPIIIINFIFIPLLLNFIRRRFFPEPTTISSIPYFVASTFIFEMILLSGSGPVTSYDLISAAAFVLYNSSIGMVLYLIYQRIRKMFLPEVIKV